MGQGGDGSQRAVARCGMEGVAICSLGLIWDGLRWAGLGRVEDDGLTGRG